MILLNFCQGWEQFVALFTAPAVVANFSVAYKICKIWRLFESFLEWKDSKDNDVKQRMKNGWKYMNKKVLFKI